MKKNRIKQIDELTVIESTVMLNCVASVLLRNNLLAIAQDKWITDFTNTVNCEFVELFNHLNIQTPDFLSNPEWHETTLEENQCLDMASFRRYFENCYHQEWFESLSEEEQYRLQQESYESKDTYYNNIKNLS